MLMNEPFLNLRPNKKAVVKRLFVNHYIIFDFLIFRYLLLRLD